MSQINIKAFFTTLFIRQNEYHKYSVFSHTIAVAKECFLSKQWDLIPAAIMHDFGKPFVAFQDEQDKIKKTFSFRGHEEKSYQLIKCWPISSKTKKIVRYHYLITGMASDIRKFEKTNFKHFKESYEQRLRIWNNLEEDEKKMLMIFKVFDDKGKGYPNQESAVPDFLKDSFEVIKKQYS